MFYNLKITAGQIVLIHLNATRDPLETKYLLV